jgi:hypothetical protein
MAGRKRSENNPGEIMAKMSENENGGYGGMAKV